MRNIRSINLLLQNVHNCYLRYISNKASIAKEQERLPILLREIAAKFKATNTFGVR